MSKITANANTATAATKGPRIRLNTSGKGNTLAWIDGLLYHGLVLNELSLVEANGKRFVSFPSKMEEKNGEKKYFPHYRMANKELGDNLSAYVNDLYEAEVNGTPVSTVLMDGETGDVEVRKVTLEKYPNLLAFVNLTYHGVRINGITLNKKKDSDDEVYVRFPNYMPKNKEGEYLLTKDGNRYVKSYLSPASHDVAEEIATLVVDKYSE
jgi:DNA-binding cell septation regulator SpoVG